jgi:hypothetical protein
MRTIPRGRAGSIEGRYRSPQHWDALTFAPSATPVAHRAMAVETAVVALPDPFKLVILLVYLRRMPLTIVRYRLRRWRVGNGAQLILDEGKRRIADALLRGDWRARRAQVARPAK